MSRIPEPEVLDLSATLDEEAFERAFAAGRALALEQAIACAMEEGREPPER